jgi:hypothetical protein
MPRTSSHSQESTEAIIQKPELEAVNDILKSDIVEPIVKSLMILNTGISYNVGAKYTAEYWNSKTVISKINRTEKGFLLIDQDGIAIIEFENVSVGIVYQS